MSDSACQTGLQQTNSAAFFFLGFLSFTNNLFQAHYSMILGIFITERLILTTEMGKTASFFQLLTKQLTYWDVQMVAVKIWLGFFDKENGKLTLDFKVL